MRCGKGIKPPPLAEENMQHRPCRENVCAVVITFNPDNALPKRIERIVDQVDRVIIVDNHSSHPVLSMIKKLSRKADVHLIANSENLGIAAALNQGMRYAIRCGYRWAYTLDQDSIVNEDVISALATSFDECPFRMILGIIGTNYRENNTNTGPFNLGRKMQFGSWVEMKQIITSGSLISIPIFSKIGPFREDFFIYYVDHEYCLRLRHHGFRMIISRNAFMIHSTGDCEIRKFFTRRVVVLNYVPWKQYYIARNGLLLALEYFVLDYNWSVERFFIQFKRFMSALMFESNKLSKFQYIRLGVLHSLRYHFLSGSKHKQCLTPAELSKLISP